MGLVSSTFAQRSSTSEESSEETSPSSSSSFESLSSSSSSSSSMLPTPVPVPSVFGGIVLAVLSSCCFASNYIFAEVIQSLPSPPTSPDLCSSIGMSCVSISSIYILLYTLPNWSVLVRAPVLAKNGDETLIVLCLFSCIVFHAVHMLTHFYLIRKVGSVALGVLRATQAIGVFAVSANVFCERQQSQCFTVGRGAGAAVVVAGIVSYSLATKTKSKNQGGRNDNKGGH